MQASLDYSSLLGQYLCGLEVYMHSMPDGDAGSLLCLGLAIHLSTTSLFCQSIPADSHRTPPQLRLRNCNREEWELYRQLPELQRDEGRWNIFAVSRLGFRMGQALQNVHAGGEATLTLCFGNEPCEIHWREDLGGYIELAPVGIRYTLDAIDPKPNDPVFGWLSPAHTHPFPAYGLTFQHCNWDGWPYLHRKQFAKGNQLPLEAARNPGWWKHSGQEHPSWHNYLTEVGQLLEIRAHSWPGWLARFDALSLPFANNTRENEALRYLQLRRAEQEPPCHP